MKVLTVVGARPQFIKAAIISKKIIESASTVDEVLLHTGQHYDENMSEVFFQQMSIPRPKYSFKAGNLSHGVMTGRMLEAIEGVIMDVEPAYVMLYGDTNSTLAGAIAAAKMNIPVIHVEAGLRSFNMKMPEEINRIVTDQVSSVLFCPTNQAVDNLRNEGFEQRPWVRIFKSGDVMYDAALYFSKFAISPNLPIPNKFVLATLHRAENTDNFGRLAEIVSSLNIINEEIPIILPLHPRTKKLIDKNKLQTNFCITEPLGYLQMLYLLKKATLVITDSGGLQKEAYFFSKPCITLRYQTEWIELVEGGYNFLVGADKKRILEVFFSVIKSDFDFANNSLYGDGKATDLIVNYLKEKC